MNRFVIIDGLPYLYADGKTYAVRWNSEGFTVGAEAKFDSVPDVTYSEISVKAKCAGNLDSIKAKAAEEQAEPEAEKAAEEQAEPEIPEPAKPEKPAAKRTTGRKPAKK